MSNLGAQRGRVLAVHADHSENIGRCRVRSQCQLARKSSKRVQTGEPITLEKAVQIWPSDRSTTFESGCGERSGHPSGDCHFGQYRRGQTGDRQRKSGKKRRISVSVPCLQSLLSFGIHGQLLFLGYCDSFFKIQDPANPVDRRWPLSLRSIAFSDCHFPVRPGKTWCYNVA